MAPSILFLIFDCLRADRAFAHARLAPDGFVGRLVDRGRSFTNAVTVTPTTTPAVASMLTGLYPFEHGLRGLLGFTLPPRVPTVASVLREAGYWTEADVTGPLLPELKLFDEFDQYRYVHRRQASIHGPRGEHLAKRVQELRSSGRPWFLLAHLWDLHEPRQVPPDFGGPALSRTVYDRALAALDSRLRALLPDVALDGVITCAVGDHGENLRFEPHGKLGKGIANLLWWKPSRWAVRPLTERVIAAGARSSSKRALRLAPRALITHGHHLFEPLLRVPYVLAGEGISHGSSRALVTHTDLAPTVAALAGTWFAGGVGAVPLPLENGEGDPDRHVVLETAWATPVAGVRQLGVRTPRWKYMQLAEGGAPALFDLVSDPAERRNLVTGCPDVAAALQQSLLSMIASQRTGGLMTEEESARVERRLEDLGYLN
jgi:arylsulfatase A-like enzyme